MSLACSSSTGPSGGPGGAGGSGTGGTASTNSGGASGSNAGGSAGASAGGSSSAGGSTSAGGGGSPFDAAGLGGRAGADNGSGGAPGRPDSGGNGGALDASLDQRNGDSGAAGSTGDASGADPAFDTRTLSPLHYAEGASVADIDGDGVLDLVAGPNWYKGPSFALGGTLIANPPSFPMDQYSTFFLTFTDDLNGDGRPDVIAIGDAGLEVGAGANINTVWYENPGPSGLSQPWARHPLFNGFVSNESPAYVNLLGDARKELVFMTNRQLGYAQPGAAPTDRWVFHAISGSIFNTPYVHGLGVGDVDGDGLADVVERTGWWRQVAAAGGAPTWEQHTFDFGMGADKSVANWGGSQMYVYDIDGDGDNDVVTALAAHQYGLSWFEQQRTGANITFVPHVILPAMKTAVSFSQLHATAMADVNGDGLPDIITGKRYYAHPSTNPDPGTTDPPVLYWFELTRSAGGASFVPHLIHDASGVGCVIAARDLNGDGKVDIFTTNKRGTFVHLQR